MTSMTSMTQHSPLQRLLQRSHSAELSCEAEVTAKNVPETLGVCPEVQQVAVSAADDGLRSVSHRSEDRVRPSRELADRAPRTENTGGVPVCWTAAEQGLLVWFAAARAAGTLPQLPFSLARHLQVVDPETFYRALERDLTCGPRGIRARLGAVQAELGWLRSVLEPRSHTAGSSGLSEGAPS